jgi:hypothetical protein
MEYSVLEQILEAIDEELARLNKPEGSWEVLK